MIPGLERLAPDGVGFWLLAFFVVAMAWSRYRRHFLTAFVGVNLVMALSWLGPVEALAMACFLLPGYLAAAWLWGRPERAASGVIGIAVTAQIVFFMTLRGYGWLDLAAWTGQPLFLIGLSYIMFRQIHLLLEAPYFGHLPLSPLRYTGYLLAFWTLLAGPIQNYDAFFKGIEETSRPADDAALAAAHRIVNGVLKAYVVAPLFHEPSRVTGLAAADAGWIDLLVVFYGYPVYLYLNFSGYVDVAIGIARLCGHDTIPENFNRPYLARNTQEFWTRWHISLGIWIRHYLFTPLSRQVLSRLPPAAHGFGLAGAVLVTFLVIGLWHGPSANFIVFGVLQAVGIIVAGLYGRFLLGRLGKEGRRSFLNRSGVKAAAVFVTFHYSCFSFMFMENSVFEIVSSLAIFVERLSG